MQKQRIFKGFTLAEVLITLAVIGVVAAMTIPSLINDTNHKEIVVKLKKAYSNFSSATRILNMECGGSILYCLSDPNVGDNDLTARSEIAALYNKKLSILKNCGLGTGCFPNVTYKNLNGTDAYNADADTYFLYKVILSDGTMAAFDWNNNCDTCSKYTITVDLNGEKGPNQLGRDYFLFAYNPKSNNLEPGGIKLEDQDCNLGASGYGYGCAAKVLSEDAINY